MSGTVRELREDGIVSGRRTSESQHGVAGRAYDASGIGQTKAQAVVNYRDAHGGFSSVEEIMNVDGIKEGLYNRIRDQIKVK